jgi:hypothetical protein
VPSLRACLGLPARRWWRWSPSRTGRAGAQRAPQVTPVKAAAARGGRAGHPPAGARAARHHGGPRGARPDVGVVAASGHILPERTCWSCSRTRCSTCTPRSSRGTGAPRRWRARSSPGDEESGATIMRVVREVDAGPVVATARDADLAARHHRHAHRAHRELGADLLARRCCRAWVAARSRRAAGRGARRRTRRSWLKDRRTASTGTRTPRRSGAACGRSTRGRWRTTTYRGEPLHWCTRRGRYRWSPAHPRARWSRATAQR